MQEPISSTPYVWHFALLMSKMLAYLFMTTNHLSVYFTIVHYQSVLTLVDRLEIRKCKKKKIRETKLDSRHYDLCIAIDTKSDYASFIFSEEKSMRIIW